MTKAKIGDKVAVHYTGKLVDGSIFDSTEGEEPLEFTIGEIDFIDGFIDGILEMSAGEKKTITLAPEQAYGERSDEMIIELPLEEIPADMDLDVGDELELTGDDEEPFLVIVSEIGEKSVTLDSNPPLAGETLVFDLELVSIG